MKRAFLTVILKDQVSFSLSEGVRLSLYLSRPVENEAAVTDIAEEGKIYQGVYR